MSEENKDGVKLPPESPAGGSADTVLHDDKLPQSEADQGEPASQPATPPKGFVPLSAVREEREHIKILEEELRKLKESPISSEQFATDIPDWDLMTESERYLAKELLQLKEKAKWEEDITRARKAFPDLAGKETEFKDYCSKFPKAMDVEVLAKSFLFKPAEPAPEAPKPAPKGLEKPTGGSRQTISPEMSLEDITRLRETQPKVYEKMIREGKLKNIPEK